MAARHIFVLALVLMAAVCARADLSSRKTLRPSQSRRLTQCSTTGFCTSKASGDYADPCASSSFIQCSNGVTYVQACPSGLVWDSKCSCCNYPSGPTSSPSPPTASPPPKSPAPTPPSTPSPTSPAPTSPSGPSSGEHVCLVCRLLGNAWPVVFLKLTAVTKSP